SRLNGLPGWLGRLKIIDSTTETLFSNLVFRGVGRDPKIGKKKGGIKVHTVIIANLLLTLVQRSLERHWERMLQHPPCTS
ncbi:MAG: hypothetical protein Q4E52_02770, partial [Fibrobacter sp.]|nr:hypothetical protein [Fibrobacter sp.]